MPGRLEEGVGQAEQHLAAREVDTDGDQLMLSVENNPETLTSNPTQPISRQHQSGEIGAAPVMQKTEIHTYI